MLQDQLTLLLHFTPTPEAGQIKGVDSSSSNNEGTFGWLAAVGVAYFLGKKLSGKQERSREGKSETEND